ncbi:hypothetical protein TNCV_4268271 [Trichonephila clavipes]|nr:hypothetical protein TNCV_4268271 [Trichonephila clavipes]
MVLCEPPMPVLVFKINSCTFIHDWMEPRFFSDVSKTVNITIRLDDHFGYTAGFGDHYEQELCSYQLNVWYGIQRMPLVLNQFLGKSCRPRVHTVVADGSAGDCTEFQLGLLLYLKIDSPHINTPK